MLPLLSAKMIFPPIESALEEPNGLLAMGGDLSTQRLLLPMLQVFFLGLMNNNLFFGGRPIHVRLFILPN